MRSTGSPLIAAALLIGQMFPVTPALAQESDVESNLTLFSGILGAGFKTSGTRTLDEQIGFYISIALGFLGVIFLILAIYAGYLWLTAGGNEEQVTKAKDYLRNAIIGILIVAAAFVISNFVISAVFPAPATPPGE